MALSESAVSALLDALRVGEGTDLVRELAQWALQQLIEAEATEKIGADPWERTGDRTTHRNGHRPRVLSTKAGDLQLGIPKLRKGSFFPELLEPRRRIDQALYAVVMEAYVNGSRPARSMIWWRRWGDCRCGCGCYPNRGRRGRRPRSRDDRSARPPSPGS